MMISKKGRIESGIEVSVIICTHNPDHEVLQQTLHALEVQTLPQTLWELLIIDNASSEKLTPERINLSGFQLARIVREDKPGLVEARLRGGREAIGKLLIFVDDDNLLNPNYLETAWALSHEHPKWGAYGGACIGVYRSPLTTDLQQFEPFLACRDLGDEVVVIHSKDLSLNRLSEVAPFLPLGAGMVVRAEAFECYQQNLTLRGTLYFKDREGERSVSCGGDLDLSLLLLKHGWEVAYAPSLTLHHLIADFRTTPNYLCSLVKTANQTWVFLTALYSVCPWSEISRVTLWLRKIKAWFSQQAWKSTAHYINWCGACGVLEGQAGLAYFRKQFVEEIERLKAMQP